MIIYQDNSKHKLDLLEYRRQPGPGENMQNFSEASSAAVSPLGSHTPRCYPILHPGLLPEENHILPWAVGRPSAARLVECRVPRFAVLTEYFSASPLWGKYSSRVSFGLYACGLFTWIRALLFEWLLVQLFFSWSHHWFAGILVCSEDDLCLTLLISSLLNDVSVEVLTLIIFNLSSW